MTALTDTPGNRVIAAFFWVLLRLGAIVLAGLSVWATTTGVNAKLGGTEQAQIFSYAAGAMNVFAIFLFFRGTVLWRQARRFGAAICFTVASLIVVAAVIYDRTGLQVILEQNNLIASASEAESTNRDELIEAAQARVERAAADSAAALRGKEIAQEALDRESATGFGERSQAAASALREANATLSAARADLRAAEEALAEARAIPVASGVSLGDASDAADTGELALGAILWGLSALLEIVSALAPSLLGLRISDRVERRNDGLTDAQREALAALPDGMGAGFRQMIAMKRAMAVLEGLEPERPSTPPPPPAPLVPAPPAAQSVPIEQPAQTPKMGPETLQKIRGSWWTGEQSAAEVANDSHNREAIRGQGAKSEAPVVDLDERRGDMRRTRKLPPGIETRGKLQDLVKHLISGDVLSTWLNDASTAEIFRQHDRLHQISKIRDVTMADLPENVIAHAKQSQREAGDGKA